MLKHRTKAAALALAVCIAVALACAGIKKGDEAVVAAERTEKAAFYLSDAFVKLERANPLLEEKLPGIRAAADKVRREAPDKLRSLHRLIDSYSAAAPGTNTPPDLQKALGVVQALLNEVTGWLTKSQPYAPAATEILKNPAGKVSLFEPPDFGKPGSALPLAVGFTVDFGTLLALLRVISTSGADVGADAEILQTLYLNLKGLWEQKARSTPEERAQLAEAEEAAFSGDAWKPSDQG